MTKRRLHASNEGIQADVVKADVLAVGRGARAVKTVLSDSDHMRLVAAVSMLGKQIDSLKLPKEHAAELASHAQEIGRAVAKADVNSTEVQSATGKFLQRLKQFGVAVKEVAGLVTPLETIGGLLHISLSALGLR